MKININEMFEVRLTTFGLKQYNAHFAHYGIRNSDDSSVKKLQLWEIIEIFGPFTHLGAFPWCEDNNIKYLGTQHDDKEAK